MTGAFWLDWRYDRDNADPGTRSRYGNYLNQATRLFDELAGDYDDPSVPFAAAAWRVATGPVMAPPLVRRHQRITSATVGRSNWDGEAFADIELVSPLPAALAGVRPPGGGWYADWPRALFDDGYVDVSEEDLARRPYLLATARLLVQLPAGTVPKIGAVPRRGDALFTQAAECVAALAAALNQQLQPILDGLER